MKDIENIEMFTRQLDIFNPLENNISTTIVGVGSVGSYVALTLCKMGITELTIYDKDTVEEHNISNQFFRPKDIGSKKADITLKLCKEFSPVSNNLKSLPKEFKETTKVNSEILISCVDTMEDRKNILSSFLTSKVRLLIDGRMGGEVMDIYAVQRHHAKHLEDYTLSLEDIGIDLPCTERTIIYNVLSISSRISNIVKRFSMKQKFPYRQIFDFKNYEQIIVW